MPHDKHGKQLKVGDTVQVTFVVKQLYPGAEMCNVTLAREEADEQQLSLCCQTKQTELIEVEPV